MFNSKLEGHIIHLERELTNLNLNAQADRNCYTKRLKAIQESLYQSDMQHQELVVKYNKLLEYLDIMYVEYTKSRFDVQRKYILRGTLDDKPEII